MWKWLSFKDYESKIMLSVGTVSVRFCFLDQRRYQFFLQSTSVPTKRTLCCDLWWKQQLRHIHTAKYFKQLEAPVHYSSTCHPTAFIKIINYHSHFKHHKAKTGLISNTSPAADLILRRQWVQLNSSLTTDKFYSMASGDPLIREFTICHFQSSDGFLKGQWP